VRSLLNTRLSERPEIAYSLYELETAINFLSPKLAISGRDTLSLDPSIKTYTDAILQIKLICRYICCHTILLYVYVYELCIKELNDETMIGASFVIQPCACDRNVPVTVGGVSTTAEYEQVSSVAN